MKWVLSLPQVVEEDRPRVGAKCYALAMMARNGFRIPEAVCVTTDAYRAYRNAVYLNGALFLEELRKLIGDEAFFSFLKDYTQQLSGKISTSDDFITILKNSFIPHIFKNLDKLNRINIVHTFCVRVISKRLMITSQTKDVSDTKC